MNDNYISQKKYMKKNLVKLGIDVKPEVRDDFRKCCELNNTLPSKVLKEFVNNYIKKYSSNEIIDFLKKISTEENIFSKLEFEDELEIFKSKIQKIQDFPEANKYVIALKNNQKIIVEYRLSGSSKKMIEITHIL